MKLANFLILITLAVLLTACANHEGFQCENTPVPEENGKPSILVIGDSISYGYTPYLQQNLQSFQVFHAPCNAHDSQFTRGNIDAWLGLRPTFKAVIYNNGLWDIATFDRVNEGDYLNNVRANLEHIKAHTDSILVVNSVSIQKYVPYRVNSDIIVYNSILELLATRFFLPVADTYTLSLGLDNLRMAPDDVHFKLEGYKVLADYITDVLKSNYGIGE